MTSSQTRDFFVPVYDTIPDEWDQARNFLVENIKKQANGINARQIGFFLDEEIPMGGQFIPLASNSQEYRSMLRKVVDFGGLPKTTNKRISHGITVNSDFTLVTLYGSATKPTSTFSAIPIPYSSPTLNENIELSMDASDIIITTDSDYSAYTRCFIIAEYIQEA